MVTDDEARRVVTLGEVDRSSAIPLYHQLEYLLRNDIESGRYGPGDALPSEGEICARYQVSRSVVRQTLTNLTHAGLIRTERGRGSFVAEKKLQERFVQKTTGLYDDLRRMGFDIRTHVVRQAVVELPVPVQGFLQTSEGVQIDRVRSVDGRVLTFIRSFIPASRCPGLEAADLENRSLYKVMADQYGLRVASGRRTVEAVAATGEVAKHLGVGKGEPLLLLRSSSRDERGQPLEWFEAWHRGDRTMFEIEIVPGEADQPVSSVVRTEHATGTVSIPGRTDAPDTAGPPPEPGPYTVRRSALAGYGMDAPPHAAAGRPPASPSGSLAGSLAGSLIEAMRRSGAVAVLRASRYAAPSEHVQVLATYGVSVVEIALTGENALAAIAEARKVDGIVVGAGPVTSDAMARDAVAAGAEFLVAPAVGQDIAATAGPTPVVLAGFTLNEVWSAWQLTGAPVKVLPASVGGTGYLTTLRDQVPGVPLVAAGGITVAEAGQYLRAGALAVAIGESLCPAAALASGDLDAVAQAASRLREEFDRASG